MKIFITGTDTNIGKTTFCAWLIYNLNHKHKKNYSYWKPIESGTSDGSDTKFVSSFLEKNTEFYQPIYSFPEPLSPHLAAKINGERISLDKVLTEKPQGNNLIIEGAGGIFVPINEDYMIIDLIKELSIPVIIISNSKLGTINHTCLTIAGLRSKNIDILGVVMNGKINLENKLAIEKYGKVKVLQEIEHFNIENNNIDNIKSEFLNQDIGYELLSLL